MKLRKLTSSVPGVRQLKNQIRTATGTRFPKTIEDLSASEIYNQWWYYSVELLPNLITKGQYENTIPMLPRLMLRNCQLKDADCLDIGTMEGLIPTLMVRGGARRVLAVDAVDHCAEKLEAVKHYHNVNFEYQSVGLMYELDKKITNASFDLINCSGLLYHVMSPFMILASLRPLLKRNGIMILSTNVAQLNESVMEFNDAGRWQSEVNTFWYVSIPLLDYLLRYLGLSLVDCRYLPHKSIRSHIRYVAEKPSGYLAVVCRAVDEPVPTNDDSWMRQSAERSWEYLGLYDRKRADANPISEIQYGGNPEKKFFRNDIDSLDLWQAVNGIIPFSEAQRTADAHVLSLGDQD